MHITKKIQSEKTAYYNYETFWEKQNHGDNKKISGCQGLGGGQD